METPADYTVSVQTAAPRAIAAVRTRLASGQIPRRFAEFLNQVYAAARSGGICLDGQNIFVYRGGACPDDAIEVEFGVCVTEPFASIGLVQYIELPIGSVATVTHWGDYARLGAAHAAVIAWCQAHNQALTGTRWEVYGHWKEDPAQVRTDVYYLLGTAADRG